MSTERRVLTINGVEKSFVCDSEETLAHAIRHLGLTGTKIGCGTAQCGACNVILDGKLVRSCVRKMKNVDDYSTIITIEGLGTADNLHPLQVSWMINGGVQCGFCSPGFIVSAKALLDENISPSREDVRDWFQKNRNACRCTGYKQIVDAVMDAAAIMRNEMTVEDLWNKIDGKGNVFNTRFVRPAALSKVLGTCDYGDDIAEKLPGAWHLAPVMPNLSHANILNIDYSEAEKAPGVHQIITAKDIKGINRIANPIGSILTKDDGFERPIISDTKVFSIGDIVALVAADTREHARAAAKLVKVDYEPLPEYNNVLDAMADDALEIHPGTPNTFLKKPLFKGEDTRKVIDESKYVAEISTYAPMQPHLTIEPDTGQAYIDEDGVLTIMYKSHGIYASRDMIAAGIGYDEDKMRIIMNPAGGGFGYALSAVFPAVIGAAAAVTNHLVTLTLDWNEHQHFTGKRSACHSNSRMACDEDGNITACELHLAFDKGCTSEFVSPTLDFSLKLAGLPYNIPNLQYLGTATYTNKAFSTAYRCHGTPEMFTNFEQVVDVLAEKVGMDPLEFRLKNALKEGQTGAFGRILHDYPYETLLNMIRPKYEELKERATKDSTPEKPHGVGIANGLFMCAAAGDHAEIAIELNPDGTVTNYNTWEDMGQGGDVGVLAFTHEALKPLGLKPEQIKLVMSDTKTCPNTGGAEGSRCNVMCGGATLDGAEKLLDAMRKEDGTYRTYDEMVAENIPTKYLGVYDRDENPFASGPDDVLDENTGYGPVTEEFASSTFVAEVEVEVETGKVEVIALHVVSDVGTVTNYTSLDGQAYSGMEHSTGYALSEDYSDYKKHATLGGAGFPYIKMLPDGENFTAEYTEIPRKIGPFGAGGASESFQSSAHIAIINAIYNATGVRMTELPAKPEKIKKALEDKAAGKEVKQEKYYLGDFYETLDYMKANPVK